MLENNQEKKKIISLLNEIQKGYTEKSLDKARRFVENLFVDEDVLVIGTSAITPNSPEWCANFEKIVTIIEDDWKYWGDLTLDIKNAVISLHQGVAFIALTGVVFEKIDSQDYYKYRLSLIEKTLINSSSPKEKILEIIQGASDTLVETMKGEDYHWPLRLTIQAISIDGEWRIKLMHFSYPIVSYPTVRL